MGSTESVPVCLVSLQPHGSFYKNPKCMQVSNCLSIPFGNTNGNSKSDSTNCNNTQDSNINVNSGDNNNHRSGNAHTNSNTNSSYTVIIETTTTIMVIRRILENSILTVATLIIVMATSRLRITTT